MPPMMVEGMHAGLRGPAVVRGSVLVRLRRRPARPKPWMGHPTLKMQLKDPEDPARPLAFHEVVVTPQVREGVPRVHLWVQSGGMGGIADLAEDEARALATALIEGIEEAHSAAVAGEPGPS